MNTIKAKMQDSLLVAGLAFIAISLFVFSFPQLFNTSIDTYFGFFAFNFIFSVFYFIILLANRSTKGTMSFSRSSCS